MSSNAANFGSNNIVTSGNLGVNTYSPSYQLDIAGTGNINLLKINDQYTFPTGVGSVGDSLVYTGSNQVAWSGVTLSGNLVGDLNLNNYDIVGTGNITVDGNITAEYFYGDLDGVVITECRNGTAGTISEGTPVYVSGYYSANGKPLIAEANASNSSTMPAVGLLASDLASGAEGHVHVFGLAQNLPSAVTNGFSVGETVYVAAGGGLTNVRPTGVSELVQNIGRVLKTGTNGRILVLGPGRSNDVPNSGHFEQLEVSGCPVVISNTGIATGSDIINNIVSLTQAEYDAATIDDQTMYIVTDATGGISSLVEDTSPQLGGNLDLNNYDITGTGDVSITGNVTATSLIKSGGTSSQFLKADGSVDGNTYTKSNNNGSLTYAAWFSSNHDIRYYGSDTKDNIFVNTDMYFQSKNGMRFLTDTGFISGTERLHLDTSEAVFNDGGNNYDFRVEGNGETHLFQTDANNKTVGIGQSNPTYKLYVKSSNTSLNEDGVFIRGVGVDPAVMFMGADTNESYITAKANGVLELNADVWDGAGGSAITFKTDNVEVMRVDYERRVGIGTATPTEKLDVNSDAIRIRTAQTPASATATGNAGDICWDSNYIYVCVATNTWKRSAISTW